MDMSKNAVKLEDWQKAGLAGRPFIKKWDVSEGEYDQIFIPVSGMISDVDGSPIILAGTGNFACHVSAIMTEHFGRDIEIVRFDDHGEDCEGKYGLCMAIHAKRGLSIPDRAAAAALAAHLTRYRPGIRVDEPVQFPRIMQDECSMFLDEKRAYQLADVCTEVFDLQSAVVADSDGWTVVIDDDDNFISAEKMAQLQGICQLLQRYSITYKPIEKITPAPEIREARLDKARSKWGEIRQALADIRDRLERIEAAGVGPEDVLSNA
jgi:hypothetical protein